jgi:glycerol transport system ATP-binding protein
VFRRPKDLVTAMTFADPPLNTIVLRKTGAHFMLDGGVDLPVLAELGGIADGSYTIGFQPHHLSLTRTADSAVPISAKVTITEITGSESFIHLDFADVRWVMLAKGVRAFQPDETVTIFLDPRHMMIFDQQGRAVATPDRMAA